MAWETRSSNNKSLIDGLIRQGIITSSIVESVMRKVDRGNYSSSQTEAYNDNPHGIGYGQTISAPHMHAMCLELLKDHISKPNSRILDVGCGSGYLTTCFGRIVQSFSNCKVIGIDVVSPLVNWAISNVKKSDADLLDKGIVQIKVGNGWQGDIENGPYDGIHVGAAAESLPQSLVDQLKNGGRLIIPIGPQSGTQYLYQIDKLSDGKVETKTITGVRYVPLVNPNN